MSMNDKIASMMLARIKNYADAICEHYASGDAVDNDKADRIRARIYKPLRQVDGIINGFKED